jgi:hypothetical protein
MWERAKNPADSGPWITIGLLEQALKLPQESL